MQVLFLAGNCRRGRFFHLRVELQMSVEHPSGPIRHSQKIDAEAVPTVTEFHALVWYQDNAVRTSVRIGQP